MNLGLREGKIMSLRSDREDTQAQQEAVESTRRDLAEKLADLSDESKKAAKAASSKRGNPDVRAVHAAWLAVDRAQEALEMALTDLAGAQGEDL